MSYLGGEGSVGETVHHLLSTQMLEGYRVSGPRPQQVGFDVPQQTSHQRKVHIAHFELHIRVVRLRGWHSLFGGFLFHFGGLNLFFCVLGFLFLFRLLRSLASCGFFRYWFFLACGFARWWRPSHRDVFRVVLVNGGVSLGDGLDQASSNFVRAQRGSVDSVDWLYGDSLCCDCAGRLLRYRADT